MSHLKGDQQRQRSPRRTSNRTAGVRPQGSGEMADSSLARGRTEGPMFGEKVMEEICERGNLEAALRRVRANRGGPGVDGMTVDELPGYLKANWLQIKERLLRGEYQPRPVKGVEIPKPGGKGKRRLGIPCVIDRFIEQAMLQVLQRRWDRTFSESSYGYRPGRSAHQALARAQDHVKASYGTVVDLDLEKFFDQVNHDRLLSRLAQEIGDKRVLKLIRAYLNAGILRYGLVSAPTKGTPQGSPLSPFLSNVVLDELDQELERRGHRFVRYADDCNIYVWSRRAGERVMASVSRFVSRRLKLRVNREKSAVDVPQKRTFLGFTFTGGRSPNRCKIAPESIQRCQTDAASPIPSATPDAPQPGNQPGATRGRVVPLPPGLDWLLWVWGEPLGPAGPGQLDSSSPAQRPMETVEGLPATPGGVDPAGREPGHGPADRVERQGPLGPQSSARGPDSASECLLRSVKCSSVG